METTKCRINCALLSPSLCSMEILICRFLAISADYSSLFNNPIKKKMAAIARSRIMHDSFNDIFISPCFSIHLH